ncbi:unnamed protein product [Caretta caretta]
MERDLTSYQPRSTEAKRSSKRNNMTALKQHYCKVEKSWTTAVEWCCQTEFHQATFTDPVDVLLLSGCSFNDMGTQANE